MPISPKDVEPYVYSSTTVDAVIKFIDTKLVSTEEKRFRLQDEEGNWSFFIVFEDLHLTLIDKQRLYDMYSRSGWPCVELVCWVLRTPFSVSGDSWLNCTVMVLSLKPGLIGSFLPAGLSLAECRYEGLALSHWILTESGSRCRVSKTEWSSMACLPIP